MTSDRDSSMCEATRLTREGKLSEATAQLQAMLAGVAQPPPRANPQDSQQTPKQASDPSRAGHLAGLIDNLRALPELRHQLDPATLKQLILPGTDLRGSGKAGAPVRGSDLPGTLHRRTYSGPAGERPYLVYVPSMPAEARRPLVVMLHGGTQDAHAFVVATRMNELAEQHGFLVAYPEQVTSANPMRFWNWFAPEHQSRGKGEPALLAGLIGEVMAEHDADTRRVYVAGFSAGAAMAAVLAGTHPDLVAAVGIHSGLPYRSAHDVGSAFAAMRTGGEGSPLARTVPMICFHGEADTTVAPVNASQLAAQFAPADAERAVANVVSDGHHCTVLSYSLQGRSQVEVWKVAGLGHAWSGGTPGASYTAPGPDASAELVRFFAEHQS